MLFTPGNNLRMIDKISRLETDAVILDLEDAVPILDKETARIFIRDSISTDEKKGRDDPFPYLKANDGPYVYVRINSLQSNLYNDDLDYVVVKGLDGVVIPKSETKEDIAKIDKTLVKAEAKSRIKRGSISLIPLIETAKGVVNVYDIAKSSERVVALGFGAVDFSADVKMQPSNSGIELLYPRSSISIAAHACGVQPIDTPWVNVQDTDGLIKDCETAKKLGFTGKLAIHPLQLNTINIAFSPSESEIGYAKKIVESFNKAAKSGVGAISLNGKMIDYASLRQAKEVLQLSKMIERKSRILYK